MSETHPSEDTPNEAPNVLSERDQAARDLLLSLNEHFHANHVTLGEHSGSQFDRLLHGKLMVNFILRNSGEGRHYTKHFRAIRGAAPRPDAPPRIIDSSQRIFDVLKEYREPDLTLSRQARAPHLERAKTLAPDHPALLFGLALYEVADGKTTMGDLTLDAVAALAIATDAITDKQHSHPDRLPTAG